MSDANGSAPALSTVCVRLARRLRCTSPWLLLAVAACDAGVATGRIEVLETLPHDTAAYTQGLEFFDGVLYESTGGYGRSTLRKVEPSTGRVLQEVPIGESYFAEGLTRVGDRLVQLTWQENVAFVYDIETLTLQDTVPVDTHGWGLCYDGRQLLSTSGGSILFRRDAESLDVIEAIQITREDLPVGSANELECVGSSVYANIYQSTEIVEIDAATGQVLTSWDAASLVPEAFQGDLDAVLNGIARDPDTGTFYLTGKRWPVVYRVRLEKP